MHSGIENCTQICMYKFMLSECKNEEKPKTIQNAYI